MIPLQPPGAIPVVHQAQEAAEAPRLAEVIVQAEAPNLVQAEAPNLATVQAEAPNLVQARQHPPNQFLHQNHQLQVAAKVIPVLVAKATVLVLPLRLLAHLLPQSPPQALIRWVRATAAEIAPIHLFPPHPSQRAA